MMMRQAPMRALALLAFFALQATAFSPRQQALSPMAAAPADCSSKPSLWVAGCTLGTFARRVISNRVACLEANFDSARNLKDRDPNLSLTVLAPDALPSQRPALGFNIILRGTAQLEGFPAAKAAFQHAAARWEAVIRTDATIILDVDFGLNAFGQPFADDTVSLGDVQALAGNALYGAVRAGLLSQSYAPQDLALYNSLPVRAVPTDAGEAFGLMAPSANLRAMGVLEEVADPDAERTHFGLPPSLAVNARFAFDFDPTDGIEAGKLDFEALVMHDIGHALGFVSFVGQSETNPNLDTTPSVWDLFRIRSMANTDDFAATERIITSGGEQSFYAGGARLALSTARPDGTGGDGKAAAHWKDAAITGQYLGVLNPTLVAGEQQVISDNDIAALDALGYRTKRLAETITVVPTLSGQAQPGGAIAPPAGLGALSRMQYAISVPPDADELQIELRGNQDVDLFARFGQTIVIQGSRLVSDYRSATSSGIETLRITPQSSLPLRAGIYYIAVANFGPGEANFTVTATVTGGRRQYAPALFDARAQVEGDDLTLTYAAVDRDGDIATAEVRLLDEDGHTVQQSDFAISASEATPLVSQLTMNGLNALPTVVRVGLVLVDRTGRRSAEATAAFRPAAARGLTITAASFKQTKLTVSVTGEALGLEVEVNGQIVAPPRKIKFKTAGGKLIVKGSAAQLGLQSGINHLRVKNLEGWSNRFTLVL